MTRGYRNGIALVALGVAAAFLAGGAQAQDRPPVTVFHDKAGWQQYWLDYAAGDPSASWEVTPFSDVANFQATVRASLSTSSAPGLFTWWSGWRMKDLVDAGLVADLTEIWQPYLDAGTISPSVASAFAFGDGIYALPNNIAYWVMYYNKNVYNELGLEVPETWDEMEANFAAIADSGRVAVGQTIDGRWPAFIWFEEFLIRTDPEFYNRLMEGEASYTDPQVEEAFLMWKDWMDKGWMDDGTSPFGFTTGDSQNNNFAQGRVAHMLVGTWFADTVTQAGLEEGAEWGLFVIPNKNPDLPPGVVFEAGPLLVSVNAETHDAAMDAAAHWMTAEGQQSWADITGFIVANAEATLPADREAARIATVIGEGGYVLYNRYWEATPSPIAENAVDEISKFVLDPTSYQEVMQNLEAIAQDYWSQHGRD